MSHRRRGHPTAREPLAVYSRPQSQGPHILLTTHYLEEAEQLCRRLAFLRRGELALEGETTDLLSQTQGVNRLEQVFRKVFQGVAVE